MKIRNEKGLKENNALEAFKPTFESFRHDGIEKEHFSYGWSVQPPFIWMKLGQ